MTWIIRRHHERFLAPARWVSLERCMLIITRWARASVQYYSQNLSYTSIVRFYTTSSIMCIILVLCRHGTNHSILQGRSPDLRPKACLSLGHRRWACQAALEKDLQSICSQWVRQHLDLCHRTRCSAPRWLLWLLLQLCGEPGQTHRRRLPGWGTHGYLAEKQR